jgi:hypothetical protein
MRRLSVFLIPALLCGCTPHQTPAPHAVLENVVPTIETRIIDGPRISTRALSAIIDDIRDHAHGVVTVTALHGNAITSPIAQAQAERVKIYLFERGIKNAINAKTEQAAEKNSLPVLRIRIDFSRTNP